MDDTRWEGAWKIYGCRGLGRVMDDNRWDGGLEDIRV